MNEKLLEAQIKAAEVDIAWAQHDGDVFGELEATRRLRMLQMQLNRHQRLGKLVDLLVANGELVQRPDSIRTGTHSS